MLTSTVLGRYEAHYFKCNKCGFLGIASPTWLQEAYDSPIASADTGILQRSQQLRPRLVCLFKLVFPMGSVIADVGAGYGVLVRTMRDVGLDFRWSDPLCSNLLARGFELGSERCDGLTAVEVLEHVVDPAKFLEESLARTGASVAVVTTEPLPSPVPPQSWWYYARPSGQHISFFERRTLAVLADRLNLRLHSRRNLHVFHNGEVARWQFAVAATRVSALAEHLLRKSANSLTEADSLLFDTPP